MDTNLEPRFPAHVPAPTYADAASRAADLAGEWREAAAGRCAGSLKPRSEVLLECADALEHRFGVQQRVVGIYLVDRAYGGPEEGGWYYDVGQLHPSFEPIVCRGNDEARAALARCEAYIAEHRMNDGRHEPNSVPCDGWYAAWSFSGAAAPSHFPEVTPRYE